MIYMSALTEKYVLNKLFPDLELRIFNSNLFVMNTTKEELEKRFESYLIDEPPSYFKERRKQRYKQKNIKVYQIHGTHYLLKESTKGPYLFEV